VSDLYGQPFYETCIWNLLINMALIQIYIMVLGGNIIALQLVMDGLKLSTGGGVGFVDGKNAILAEDAANYNGESKCLIR
jgi:hypothetical protein